MFWLKPLSKTACTTPHRVLDIHAALALLLVRVRVSVDYMTKTLASLITETLSTLWREGVQIQDPKARHKILRMHCAAEQANRLDIEHRAAYIIIA